MYRYIDLTVTPVFSANSDIVVSVALNHEFNFIINYMSRTDIFVNCFFVCFGYGQKMDIKVESKDEQNSSLSR